MCDEQINNWIRTDIKHNSIYFYTMNVEQCLYFYENNGDFLNTILTQNDKIDIETYLQSNCNTKNDDIKSNDIKSNDIRLNIISDTNIENVNVEYENTNIVNECLRIQNAFDNQLEICKNLEITNRIYRKTLFGLNSLYKISITVISLYNIITHKNIF